MDFWNQLPNSTKVYLTVLLGLSILFMGLIFIRAEPREVDWPSPAGLWRKAALSWRGIPTPEDGAPSATGIEETQIFSGPGEDTGQIGKLKTGQTAEVAGISSDSQWWIIKVPAAENGLGWVKGEQVRTGNTVGIPVLDEQGNIAESAIPTDIGPEAVAKANSEILAGPGDTFGKVGILEMGQRAEVIGRSADHLWWVIEVPYAANGRGWIAAGQVSVDDVETIPVVPAAVILTPNQTPKEEMPTARAITNVNIRSGPGMNFKKVGTLQNGQETVILGKDPEGFWWLVILPGSEDEKGWVSRDYVIARKGDQAPVVEPGHAGGSFVVPTPAANAPKLTAITMVNIRAGPGKQFEILGQLEQGQTAEVVGRSGDGIWWVVRVEGGKSTQGWVAAAYATVQNGGDVPIIEP